MLKKIEPHPLTLKSILENSIRKFGDFPSVSFVDGNPITYSTYSGAYPPTNSGRIRSA